MQLLREMFSIGDGENFSRCTLHLGGGAYFEGVKSVGEFSPQTLVLYFPKTSVEITGEGLFIGKYCEGDLLINGKINQIRLLDGVEKK